MQTDLKNKTFRGIIWSSLQRFSMMFINLASNIILARLLTPDDFGCVAMLMIFISLANTIIDGGFGAALIQKKTPTHLDYSTIFYFNILLSIILYSTLYIIAPAISAFYGLSSLSIILRIQGVVLLFNALTVVQQNILRKQLRFKTISIIYIVSGIVSLVVAIIMAWNGHGVWSLVAQQLTMSMISAVLFWSVCQWRPSVVFSFQSLKELFGFGSFMLLSSLFSTLSTEIQGLLVGKKFNTNALGLYNQAYRLEGAAATAISSLMDQVTFPVLSSLQDNNQEFVRVLKRFIQIPAYICSLIMMILIVVAEPLVLLLYTEKWIDAVPYFQILCTAGLAVSLQGTANNALAAIGKSKELFTWTIVKRSLTILLCIFGIIARGMNGLLWMCVVGAWLVYFINSYLVSRYIGYSFRNQILDILPSITLALFTGLLVSYLDNYLSFGIYINACIQVLLCIVVYFFVSKVLKLSSYQYVRDLALKLFSHFHM